MRRRCLFALSLAIVISVGFWVQADVIETRFQELDTNNDGKLSEAERKDVPERLRKWLAAADRDADGVLTLDEIRTSLGQPKGKSEPPPPPPELPPVREGPKALPPAAAGVGRFVPDLELRDFTNQRHELADLIGENGLVIAFTNTSCPISAKYGPTLTGLQLRLRAAKMGLLLVNPTKNESHLAMKKFAEQHKLTSPYIHDHDGKIARTLGATSTTEVFFLDPRRTIVYRGAIDDQYGFGYSRETPTQNYLLDAIRSYRDGRAPDPAATTAPGCELELGAAKATTTITYHNRISRIMQTHCVECHREGGVGPFTLTSFDDVAAHAGMIRKVVDRGTMPPWFAVDPAGSNHRWANDRSLPAADKADLLAWLSSDRPLGNPDHAPAPRSFADGWLIGTPDAVFVFPKPVTVKATGTMPYQFITIETDLTEDKWVQAVEVRPSARAVVHHVIVSILAPGSRLGVRLRDADDETRGFFGIYVPGQSVLSYPAGMAKKLPKGSRLRFQMHYTPNGTATEDTTRVGFVFADREPQFEVKVAGIADRRLNIAPGADNHHEYATLRVPQSTSILGFLPHMHLRGKAFRYELTPPGGKPEVLLDVPRYDFNWQLYYRLAEPKPVLAGTPLTANGWFDNSSGNPANPDPSKTVRWGPQTFDEMLLGYVEYIVPTSTGAK